MKGVFLEYFSNGVQGEMEKNEVESREVIQEVVFIIYIQCDENNDWKL